MEAVVLPAVIIVMVVAMREIDKEDEVDVEVEEEGERGGLNIPTICLFHNNDDFAG